VAEEQLHGALGDVRPHGRSCTAVFPFAGAIKRVIGSVMMQTLFAVDIWSLVKTLESAKAQEEALTLLLHVIMEKWTLTRSNSARS
jgi:hypothetical protein